MMKGAVFSALCVASALVAACTTQLVTTVSADPTVPGVGGDDDSSTLYTNTSDGGSDADSSSSGQLPVPPDPTAACPTGYQAQGAGPKAGANTGFSVGGQSRTFHMILPPTTFQGPRPLFVALHGTGESGKSFSLRARLQELANRGFIVVAPDAVGNGSIWPVWDAMRLPSSQSKPNLDVAFFDALVACTSAHHSIDSTRIFAGGHSAGGIFTNRLLRSRSKVLAGGIVGSGVFDFTGDGANASLDNMLVLVTWGGDNDAYSGTTPNGVTVPSFNFVEQASLASKYYDAQANVAFARCRGDNLGHAWLNLNDWFADAMLAHPKGTAASAFSLAATPAGSRASCSDAPYDLAPLPAMTCPASKSRPACEQTCQLFADCAVENRTVGPSIASELADLGFSKTSCAGCVSQCASAATDPSDAAVLSCFKNAQAGAQCTAGIEGAMPLFATVNQCCYQKSSSGLCTSLCTTLMGNSAASAFFPACATVIP